MSRYHNLHDKDLYVIQPGETPLERVNSFKLLGVMFSCDLTWNEHISKTIKNCYATLKSLRRIKNYTPIHVRKNLAQALVLSKLDYANAVFYNAPEYLKKQMQRVQNSAASFVQRRYMKEADVVHLDWLPIRERIEYSICKLAFKALYFQNWPLSTRVNLKSR